MKKVFSSTISITVLLVFGSFGCSEPQRSIKLATYTYATDNRLDKIEPLAVNLRAALGRPVETTSYPDVASFVAAIKADEVDIALINTLGYLVLALDNKHMTPVATLKVKKGAEDNYKTAVLTNNDKIKSLDLLQANAKSLTMMFVAEGSTSGNLVPRLMLSSLGLKSPESDFGQVTFGGNHTSTFQKLEAGEADLCAIGSNEYFKQLEKDSTTANRLLWMSEEIPLGPVLINKRMTKAERQTISNLLFALHEEDSLALDALKSGWSEAQQAEKFYPIDDAYYNSFRQMNGNATDLATILQQFNY
ncbi:MAG: phosphate/phosphite/phosphonate ABC transporter substrate-binding protein [Imperialibacter sp.]|uniref:phosphate/phosphite/phosphonate ABC transporter substrate-binding protein n=1 Tax=Imperialibacter sp. TaxID=2038411 RepID=UPI003A85647D